MRLLTALAWMLSTLLLSGCTYSVHPILLESDRTTDVDLSGTWDQTMKDPKKNGWYTLSAESLSDGSRYSVKFREKDSVAEIGMKMT